MIVVLFVVYILFKLLIATTEPKTTLSLNQSAVIKQIQSLNKLETASFTIEKIIEGGTNGNAFQNILYGDKILLIAHGNVVAGFDLSKVSTSSVTVNGGELHIALPAPEILYSRIDNTQTKVYDRKLGLLTKGDPTLESQARLAAETSIRAAACTGGILEQASQNMRQQFGAMFTSLGYTSIVFEIPVGVCN